MTYATRANLVDRFGLVPLEELTDQSNSGKVDDDLITNAIDNAVSEIDSYLSGRYTTPVDPAPAYLTKIACDIAFYNLHDDHPTEGVEKLYKAAVAWLKDVAAGKASLGIPDESTGFGVSTSHEYSDRTFTKDTLESF